MVDLTRIPQLARNLNRVAEIVGTLMKYGLADWFARLDSRFVMRISRGLGMQPITQVSHEARIRLALTELGTTFIKLGQMLSTRRDMIGLALADELTHLQSRVPADPFSATRQTIEAELKKPLNELFAHFEEQPLASASIGQAHKATLPDGRKVIVKVQHPDILGRVQSDLGILAELASLAEQYLPDMRAYRPTAVVGEFQRVLLRELDFRRELRHLQIFCRNFATDDGVVVPAPFPEYSTERVIVMEFLEGVPLSGIKELGILGDRGPELARQGARVFLQMIFRDGFYHADPHPGNILLLPDGRLGILDGGMVGRLDDALRGHIEAGMAAVMRKDAAALTDLVIQVGQVPPELDLAGLQNEIADQIAFYWGMPLDQFNLATALNELTEALRKYQVTLPATISLLIKVLVMLEGTGRLLDPHFKLTAVLEDYRKQFLFLRLSPKRMMLRAFRNAGEWHEVVQSLPRVARDLLRFARERRFAVQLQHQHLEPSVNRLVFGTLVSALFVGSSLLWAFKAPPVWHDVSIFGMLGCLSSIFLGFRLFRAIQKSGKLQD